MEEKRPMTLEKALGQLAQARPSGPLGALGRRLRVRDDNGSSLWGAPERWCSGAPGGS